MSTLVSQLIAKMGLRDEPGILEKTIELMRLLELRSSNVPVQVNEYGKIVLCADIAAELLGIVLDREQALKLSSLRKSHYTKHKRMFEKLLDINKIVGINDICVQLGITEVSQKAHELLELYKKVAMADNPDDDVVHPQYAAMATFQACKLMKKKLPKTKFMHFSNLRPTQWLLLEQRWEKFIAKHYNSSMSSKLKKTQSAEEVEDNKKRAAAQQADQVIKQTSTQVEDYEKWKNRILTLAQNKLKQQQKEDTEKENMILGM